MLRGGGGAPYLLALGHVAQRRGRRAQPRDKARDAIDIARGQHIELAEHERQPRRLQIVRADGDQEIERQRLTRNFRQAVALGGGFRPDDDHGLELPETRGALRAQRVRLAIERDEVTAPHERGSQVSGDASVFWHMTDEDTCHVCFLEPRSLNGVSTPLLRNPLSSLAQPLSQRLRPVIDFTMMFLIVVAMVRDIER